MKILAISPAYFEKKFGNQAFFDKNFKNLGILWLFLIKIEEWLEKCGRETRAIYLRCLADKHFEPPAQPILGKNLETKTFLTKS